MASGLEAEGYSVAHSAAKAEGLERSAELAESACGVVLWSKAGVRHDGLAISAAQAFNAGKLTPIFLQDVEPPYPYDLIPGLDATGWKGDREEPAWRDILSTIRDALGGKVPAPRAAPAPAPPAPVRHEPAPAAAPAADAQANWFATRRAEAAAPAPAPAPVQQAPAPPPPAPPPPPPPPRQAAPERTEPRPLPATHETYVDDARPKFALAPVLVGAFLLAAAALWAGPRIYANLKGDEAAPAAAEEVSPEFASVPAAEELPSEPAPPEPQAVESAEGGVEVSPEQPAAAQPDPESTLQALEQCLGRLAKQCGPLEPSLGNGFVTDGRLSASEMRLLASPLFPDRSLVTAQNLNACLGATTTAALGRACPSIAAKVNPPVVSVRPQIPEPIKAPAKPAHVAAKPAPAEKVAEPKVEPKPEAKPEPKPAAKPAPEPEAPKPKVAAPEL